jgi:hypothetical protein
LGISPGLITSSSSASFLASSPGVVIFNVTLHQNVKKNIITIVHNRQATWPSIEIAK